MAAAWLMTTILVCAISIALNLATATTDSGGVIIAASALPVVLINLVFWLPAAIWQHKARRVTLPVSIIASVASAALGLATLVGLATWLMATSDGELPELSFTLPGSRDAHYTHWKIAHVHYSADMVVLPLVLWTCNGVIFWTLYERLSRKL
jgi:hypothetical protein